jgi:hypothetical protein
MDFDISLHFVNPGGEELSSGEILYKPLTLGFALCWAALAGLLVLAMAREQCVWACRRRRQLAAGGGSPLSLSLDSVQAGGGSGGGERPPVR